jgi:hypothetical protein
VVGVATRLVAARVKQDNTYQYKRMKTPQTHTDTCKIMSILNDLSTKYQVFPKTKKKHKYISIVSIESAGF